MKNVTNFVFSILFLFVLVVVPSVAQEIKPISGGVLNGKATSLPKPAYPPAARAVGASGTVVVQVLIDENGMVISATAISGHPLLRAAAVQAAQSAAFSPTRLSGQPVKVSGVIVYNFVGPVYTARLGFVLNYADRTGSFGPYQTPQALASQLASDWIEEKRVLNSLSYEEGVIASVIPPPPPPPPDSTPAPPKDSNRYTIKGEASASNRRLDAKSQSSVREVLKLIEARSSSDESSAWALELGRLLSVLVVEIHDESKFASNLSEIESLAGRAPSRVPDSSLQQLKEFIEYGKQWNLRDDAREEIIRRAESVSTLRY